jgi:hypothetical protein
VTVEGGKVETIVEIESVTESETNCEEPNRVAVGDGAHAIVFPTRLDRRWRWE